MPESSEQQPEQKRGPAGGDAPAGAVGAAGGDEEITDLKPVALGKASELTLWEAPKAAEVRGGQAALRFPMPRQSVSLLRLEW